MKTHYSWKNIAGSIGIIGSDNPHGPFGDEGGHSVNSQRLQDKRESALSREGVSTDRMALRRSRHSNTPDFDRNQSDLGNIPDRIIRERDELNIA